MNYRKSILLVLVISSFFLVPVSASVQPEYTSSLMVSVSRETKILGASVIDDGEMILAGKRILSGNQYALLMKVNDDGDITWEKTYGDGDDYLTDVIQADNGDYIAIGTSTIDDNDYAWIIRTSPAGTLIWEYNPLFMNSYGESLIEDNQGNIVWVGQRYVDGEVGVIYYGLLDADGNQVKHRTLWYPEEAFGKKILQTNDGGYLIAGDGVQDIPNKRQFLLQKLDSDFNEGWLEMYGSNPNDYFYDVLETPLGQYAVFSGLNDYGPKGMVSLVNKTGDIDTFFKFQVPPYFTGKGLVRLGDGDYVFAGVVNDDINYTYLAEAKYSGWSLEFETVDAVIESVDLVGDNTLIMAGTINFSGLVPVLQTTSSIGDPPCSLKVTVRRADGSPIRGADVVTVTKMDVGINGVTDSSGEVNFNEVTPGTHTIQISATGYESGTMDVECPSGESISIIVPLMEPEEESSGTETEPESDTETETDSTTEPETDTSTETESEPETSTDTETDTSTDNTSDTDEETSSEETSSETTEEPDTPDDSDQSNNTMLYIGGAAALVVVGAVAYFLGTKRV